MLYAITLRYVRPKEEVDAHLDAHRQWLAAEVRAGHVLAAGPLEPGEGGFVLAFSAEREDIDAMIARDPFHVHGIAAFEVEAVQTAVRSAAFPGAWAPHARVIG